MRGRRVGEKNLVNEYRGIVYLLVVSPAKLIVTIVVPYH